VTDEQGRVPDPGHDGACGGWGGGGAEPHSFTPAETSDSGGGGGRDPQQPRRDPGHDGASGRRGAGRAATEEVRASARGGRAEPHSPIPAEASGSGKGKAGVRALRDG
jgi:hypothetical protein